MKTGSDTDPIWCNGAEVDVETGLVLKQSYPMSKLTFKSTRGTDTMQKLAETDPKSALRLPKWVMITMVKEKL